MSSYMRGEERRFDLGRVIERIFGVLAARGGRLAALALILVGAPQAAASWMQSSYALNAGADELRVAMIGLAVSIVSLVASSLLQAAVVHTAYEDLQGRESTLAGSLSVAFTHVFPLFVMTLIAWLGIALGLLLLIAPGLLLMTVWSVATPVRVIERKGIFGSLGRSLDLTDGARWQIFGLILIYTVVVLVLSFLIGRVVGVATGTLGQGAMIAAASVVSGLTATFGGLVTAVGTAVIYFSLRERRGSLGADAVASAFD